jgi:hypothetical protein
MWSYYFVKLYVCNFMSPSRIKIKLTFPSVHFSAAPAENFMAPGVGGVSFFVKLLNALTYDVFKSRQTE